MVIQAEVYNDRNVKVLEGTDKPKKKALRFGGIKGQAICTKYAEMSYDIMDKDGVVRTHPLFNDINICTQRYTFSCFNSLLFAARFAQIALVITERATFECMRSRICSGQHPLHQSLPWRILSPCLGCRSPSHLVTCRHCILSRYHHATSCQT